MKADDLHELWTNGPKMRMSTQPYSFRLPIVIGAQIEALCEIYPQKNRTEIVTDLLSYALEHMQRGLPTDPIQIPGSRKIEQGGMKALFEQRCEEIFDGLRKRHYGYEPYIKVIPVDPDKEE